MHLPTPPPGGPGVCLVCRTFVPAGYALCWQCARQRRLLPAHADIVRPIALAEKGGAWARLLWQYKSTPLPNAASVVLAQVLNCFLLRYEGEIAAAAAAAAAAGVAAAATPGVGRFAAVTVVPSARRDGTHPLAEVLADVPAVSGRLRPFPQAAGAGEPVLLVDDTWTTGWHAQRAAAALKRCGVPYVATVVCGRHVATAGSPPPG